MELYTPGGTLQPILWQWQFGNSWLEEPLGVECDHKMKALLLSNAKFKATSGLYINIVRQSR